MTLVVKDTDTPDEYMALHGDIVVGQIYKRKVALAPENQWLWALNGVPEAPLGLEFTGLAATLEEAKTALDLRWSKWLSAAKLAELTQSS